MLFGGLAGDLEIRKRGSHALLRGIFPYNSLATLSDGGRRGRPKKERFGKRAFRYSVESPDQEIHILVGHDFGKPLASKLSGSVKFTDSVESLIFEAELADEVLDTSHGRDAVALLSAGLFAGISPGFRIPPEGTVPGAETIEEENPKDGNAIIRTINEAILYEISLVTRPAYPDTTVEQRNWVPNTQTMTPNNARYRWR